MYLRSADFAQAQKFCSPDLEYDTAHYENEPLTNQYLYVSECTAPEPILQFLPQSGYPVDVLYV